MKQRTFKLAVLGILCFVAFILFAISSPAIARPAAGVTNFESLHLRDSNATAVPNFVADQRGLGVIAEFRDSGTPVARIANGGGFSVLSGPFVLGQQSETVTATFVITPTAPYVVMSSNAGYTSSTTTPIITTTATTGQILILRNGNASNVLVIDGVGGTVECKADVSLGASDTLTLIYNGSAWNCVAGYDNS